MVPSEIARDRDLTPGAKLLLAAILSLTRASRGRCTAGNDFLAEMTGLAPITVRRLLPVLEARGLISRVIEHSARVEITVHLEQPPCIKKDQPSRIDSMQAPASNESRTLVSPDAPNEIPHEKGKKRPAGCPTDRSTVGLPASGEKARPLPIQQNLNPRPKPPDPDPDPVATARLLSEMRTRWSWRPEWGRLPGSPGTPSAGPPRGVQPIPPASGRPEPSHAQRPPGTP